MGLSDTRPDADPPQAATRMVIVPMDAPGVSVMRNLPLLNHHSPEGHTETDFDQVRVPAANILGEEGAGFALAQARLGPGRIHHCMRSIGQCEVALELMIERALQRKAFSRNLADYANIQDWIAEGRMEIDQARLLCLRAAWMMDTHGNKAARTEVSVDQGRGDATADEDRRPGDAGLRRGGPLQRHAARLHLFVGPGAALHRRAGRGASAHRRPRRDQEAPGQQSQRLGRARRKDALPEAGGGIAGQKAGG